MTYRDGVYVIDRRTGRLGRVLGNDGSLQLCAPDTGATWECPPDAARLATQAERRAAGIAANGATRDRAEGARQ
ncbi:hypothetical protein ACFW4X_21150 [Streptomyces smyrnaeus]|uniref:hypothetical protein n=1 Tax=Streptomyces smyrnaeus TaxID=1387713 RepID=UPI0036B43B8F